MNEFIQIKETCIYSENLEAAFEFYHKVLELPVIQYLTGKHLFLKAGSSVLLIFNPNDSRNKTSPPAHYATGKQHFAFEVSNSDYEKVKEKITEKGISIIDEVTWPSGKKSFYFNDPAGNVLEILPENGIWN